MLIISKGAALTNEATENNLQLYSSPHSYGAFQLAVACTWFFGLASASFPAAAGGCFQKNNKSNKPIAHNLPCIRKQTDTVKN